MSRLTTENLLQVTGALLQEAEVVLLLIDGPGSYTSHSKFAGGLKTCRMWQPN
ncbi:hypothetical protein [Bacillus solitudinis]|uniref:hypothetical protein n=1 Tax=Bacillus solitudinis TaxID=2014074 RepID=UPI0012FE5EA9|nr:hypothetical protein [Bacillus solitudinis]